MRNKNINIFKNLFAQSNDMYYRLSLPDEQYEYISNGSHFITGYPANEISTFQQFIDSVVHQDSIHSYVTAKDTLLNGEESSLCEFKINHKDGTARWVCQKACIVKSDEDIPIAIEGVLIDITEKVNIQEELEKTKNLLLTAVDQAQAGIIIADAPNVNIRFANSAALGIRGERIENLINIPIDLHPKTWQTFYPDGRSYEAEDLPLSRAILKGVESKNVEVVIKQKDGSDRWVLANAAPIFNAKGNIIAGIVIFQDITDRILAQQNLKLTQYVTDHSVDAILWILENGSLLYANKAASKMSGYSIDELLGMNVIDLDINYTEETAREMFHFIKNSSKNELSHLFPSVCKRKDGTKFPIESTMNYINFGETEFVNVYVRDISERLEAEREIEQSLVEKDTLLKEIHHRVKNNMQIVSSLLDLQTQNLPADTDTSIFQDSISRIHAMALVHEKLYKSDNFSNINFKKYIETLIKDYNNLILCNEKEIIFNLNLEDVIVKIDYAVPCGLILNELITNAIKHAFLGRENGEIQILLKSKDGLYTLIVSDNGVCNFTSFDITKVSSLGLQLVKNLVKQLKGNVEVSAEKGFRFEITFGEKRANETLKEYR